MMASQDQVMQCYEQIASLTTSMLQLARAGDWDALATQELAFRVCVDRLRALEPTQALDAAQVEKKYQLLRKIIADDAEIRDLVTPELARLGELLGSMRRQRNLNRTYGQQ